MTFSRGEADYLITDDGEEFALHRLGCKAVMGGGGRGMPPLNFITRQGFAQHGVSVTDYRLEPRIVSLQFYEKGMSRDDYWTNKRARLIDILRPNRALASKSPASLTLRKIFPLGQRRDILCYSEGTPAFESESLLDFGITEPISLFCPDPSFFDPTSLSAALATTANTELVFPITFDNDNIFFGSEVQIGTVTIAYTGTWFTWPTIVITGPYSTLTLENETMGVSFTLGVPKTAADTVTIDLTPGAQSITDQNGNNLFNDLSSGNLVDWFIAPDPIATDGNNVIKASATNKTGNTAVTISYNTRYIGI